MEQKYREMLVPIVLSVSLFALLNNLLGSFIQNIVFYVVYNDLIFRVLNFALNFLCLFASYFAANYLLKKNVNYGVIALASIAGAIINIVIGFIFGIFPAESYIPLIIVSLIRSIFFYAVIGAGEFLILQFSTPGQAAVEPIPAAMTMTPMPTVTGIGDTITNNGGNRTMYCRNCGSEMNENAVVCVKCGVAKGMGNSYCPNCGKETDPNAAFCINCGCALTNMTAVNSVNSTAVPGAKSKLVAGLLGIFLGGLGIHNFYLGYTQKAIIQVLLGTVGAIFFFIGPVISGIWGLVEGILILVGKINEDGKGFPLKD